MGTARKDTSGPAADRRVALPGRAGGSGGGRQHARDGRVRSAMVFADRSGLLGPRAMSGDRPMPRAHMNVEPPATARLLGAEIGPVPRVFSRAARAASARSPRGRPNAGLRGPSSLGTRADACSAGGRAPRVPRTSLARGLLLPDHARRVVTASISTSAGAHPRRDVVADRDLLGRESLHDPLVHPLVPAAQEREVGSSPASSRTKA